MTELPQAALDAASFYDAHYAGADPIFLKPGNKLMLGDPGHPHRCRFCRREEPEVTFKDEAHALPASFGNTGLFSRYECDECNHLFGEGIENHLGNWTKPMRTLSRIRGRSGVPTIKKPGPDWDWGIEVAPFRWTPMMLSHEVFPYAQNPSPLRTRVPAADGRSGPRRPRRAGSGPRV